MPLSPLYLWQWYKTERCTHNTMEPQTSQLSAASHTTGGTGSGDELSVPLFTCERNRAGGWDLQCLRSCYTPRTPHPTFFKVIKKKSRTEDNWLLNVVSGTKCLLLPSFFLSFLLKLGQGKGASGRGGCNPGLMGPLWDWSFWKNFKWSEMTKLPQFQGVLLCGVGGRGGRGEISSTELTGTLGT